MSDTFFYMFGLERKRLIDNHKFYVNESCKRLLSQFNDIESEADQFGEKALERNNLLYNPDSDNAEQLMEAAREEMHSHYEMLESIRKTTRLSIISGMFFEWDKQIRSWMTEEVSRWHLGAKVKEEIWRRNFDEIIDLFEGLSWPVTSQCYYTSLNRCRLVVNAYKHGEGAVFESIKKDHQDLISPFPETEPNFAWLDFSMLQIEEKHISEFSKAIISFWENLPEDLPCSEVYKLPKWFKKAYETDK